MTESLLASIGITQDRYKEAKAFLGLAPTCNCDGRREWMNRASKWLKDKLRGGES